jgi:5-methylthioribose kinase
MLELTPENATDFLRARGWIRPGPAHVETLGWGVSNLVLRVVTPERNFIVKQSRPQLRTRDAWYSDLERIYREQEVMEVLHGLLPEPTVPKVLFSDRDNYLFAMSHAPAEARVWKKSLLARQIDPALAEHAGRILAQTHEQTAQCPRTIERFGDRKVFFQLRVDPFYVRVQERRPEVAAAIDPIVHRLMTVSEALCHGDYSPKNILTHDRGFTLVDYETAHLGDPTMDLGFFLSHLVLKAVRHWDIRDQFFDLTRAFWRRYAAGVHFRPPAELQARGIEHFAVCALARIDGTSPVDYLPEESKREAVRQIGRRVLFEKPESWERVLSICNMSLP